VKKLPTRDAGPRRGDKVSTIFPVEKGKKKEAMNEDSEGGRGRG